MHKSKVLLAAVMAAALSMSAVSVDARVGSSSGGSKSTSSVSSSRSSSSSSSSSTSSSRIGGGSSSGMKRESAVREARSQSSPSSERSTTSAASQRAPASGFQPAPNRYDSGSSSTQSAQPQRGYSGGQLAGAAVAGAAAGYLLHKATQPDTPSSTSTPSTNAVPSGQVTPAVSTGSNWAAPAAAAAEPSSAMSGVGLFLTMAIMAALAVLALVMWSGRRKATPGAPSSAARSSSYFGSAGNTTPRAAPSLGGGDDAYEELLSAASRHFRDLQDANNREDRARMERLVHADYLPELTADFGRRAEPSATQVSDVRVVGNKVLSFEREASRYVGSIHFEADIREGDGPLESIEEVWHYVRDIDAGSWKLAGIEQL